MKGIDELDGEIDAILAVADALATGLNDEQANRRPGPRLWSVADCLGHLTLSAELYLTRIDPAIERAHPAAGPFRYAWLERYLIRHVEPPAKFKVRTDRRFLPPPPRPLAEVMSEFHAVHEHVRRSLRATHGLDRSLRLPHPAIPLLRFTLGGAFAILTGHARRHLWQARQVRQALPPAPAPPAGL